MEWGREAGEGRLVTTMPYDLVVRGGTVVTPKERYVADIGVRGGKIAAISRSDGSLTGKLTIDAQGQHVLPGLIDVHAHHREPGFTHKGDIETETMAAAAGGVTTSLGMPNVQPPPNTPDALASMLDLYSRHSFIDYNVNAAGTIPGHIAQLAEMGIAAFKVFMVVDTGRSYPHMPGIGVHDHGDLLAIFEAIAPTGLPLMVHPHDQALMRHIEEGYWARGERDFRAYAKAYAAHDGIIWDSAVALLIRLQQATEVPLHLLHTQSRGVIQLIREAKAMGRSVTAEVNPWALFLGNDWANVEELGSYALSYWVPEEHARLVWDALVDGTIDLVSTDHAPHLPEEKEPGWTDGWKAHTGTPSAQFYLSLLLDAAAAGRISLERVVEATSTIPAEVFRLGNKGSITIGADADLTIVDLSAIFDVRDDIVLSRCGWTPYRGRSLRGSVVHTIVRGVVVYSDGQIVGQPGWGQQARPTATV